MITINGEDWPLYLAALCVWREARGEPLSAQTGVAEVIRNRLGKSEFGGQSRSIADVVLHPFAFSSFNHNDPNSLLFPHRADMDGCLLTVQRAFGASLPNNTQGAVFYHDVSLNGPPGIWGPVTKTVQLGRLIFYKRG